MFVQDVVCVFAEKTQDEITVIDIPSTKALTLSAHQMFSLRQTISWIHNFSKNSENVQFLVWLML